MRLHFWNILFSLFLLAYSNGLAAQENDLSKILWAADWSHDNAYFAIGGNDSLLRIYSADSFKLVKSYKLEHTIERLHWHPTRNVLAVAGYGFFLVDVERDSIQRLIGEQELKSDFIGRSIAWNRNGTLLAIADYEGRLSIWTEAGKHLRTIFKDATKSYVAVTWHPQKDEIIVLSEFIRMYDLKGNLLKKLEHRAEKVLMLSVQWHPSGEFFVIGDYGDMDFQYPPLLQFWSPEGKRFWQSDISKAEYRNVSWNADGTKLASASDALRIWSQTGQLLHEGPSDDYLWGIDWSQDGRYIVTSSETGQVRLWDNQARLLKTF